MHRQEIDRLRIARVAHVGDHDASAHACTNVCVTARDHDLDAVAAAALVGVAEEFDIPGALRDDHDLPPIVFRRQCRAGSTN